MSNPPTVTTVATTGTAYIPVERSCMITESRLEHIESLVDRAKRFELKTDKWNVFQVFCSASGAIFLTILSVLISVWIGQTTLSGVVSFILYLAWVSSGISCFLSFLYCKREESNRTQNHESLLTEVHDIIQRMRGSFNSQGNP